MDLFTAVFPVKVFGSTEGVERFLVSIKRTSVMRLNRLKLGYKCTLQGNDWLQGGPYKAIIMKDFPCLQVEVI